MNNEKVYIEGYIVGLFKETTFEEIGHRIQLANGDIVDIDNRFVHKSIEPEKVTIPQFVADWYEENKDNFDYKLWEYLVDWDRQDPSDFKEWMAEGDKYEPLIILVNMHQFGYEVEKEKRYKIVMKETKQPLYYNAGDKKLFFSMAKIASHFTRQQLEKLNFGWVFDCEGVEVEEVEE